MPIVRSTDFSSFAWSVGCGEKRPGQVRDDVTALVRQLCEEWRALFPASEGYEVTATSPAGAGHGVQLAVRRGDFRATVAVATGLERRVAGAELHVRMNGRAESSRIARLDETAGERIARLRRLGATLGVGVFAAMCWFVVGVRQPALLGGLMMVVALMFCLSFCSSLGGALGERWIERVRSRTVLAAARDRDLQLDRRRWRAVARQLAARRGSWAGCNRGQPFRAPARALATGSG